MMQNFDEFEWKNQYDSVYGYFYRRVNSKSDVEDLTMETLEAFYLSSSQILNSNSFLWGIARNKLLEYIRNKSKMKTVEWQDWHEVENSDNNLSVENWVENLQSENYSLKLEKLKVCAKNWLNTQEQEIIQLCINEDFKSQEVALKLNLTAANVRQKLSRSLKKLRENCKKIWFEV